MANPTQPIRQWNLEGAVANNIKAIRMGFVPFSVVQNLLSRDGSAIALLLSRRIKAIPWLWCFFSYSKAAIARWERHRMLLARFKAIPMALVYMI